MTPFLFAVRHGETDANAENRLLGHLDPPLNRNGLAHARRMGAHLRPFGISRIISSPLQRAKTTADIIAEETGAPVGIDERLKEVDYGDLDGMTIAEAMATGIYGQRDRDRMAFQPPNGETYLQLLGRVEALFNELKLLQGTKPVLLVAHLGAIRMIAAHLRLMTPQEAAGSKFGHECVLTVSRNESGGVTAQIEDLAQHERV